jgi:hypothetical protein
MQGNGPTIKATTVRVLAVLAVLALAFVPVASGYLNINIDSTEYVVDKTCFCHDPEPSEDVDIILNVPRQVAFTPDNRSVSVSVGILGLPDGITGFGLLLNASKDPANIRWENKFDIASDSTPFAGDYIKVNGSVMYSINDIEDDWFNVSFIPGNANQTLELTVIGMNADNNGNETGDRWNVLEAVEIEVSKQRLMTLNVPITNLNPISLSEILVDFYIDDEYIGNYTIPHVPSRGKENATIDWDVTFKKEGKYKLRAVIDPEGHLTETDRSNNEVTRTIWLGGPPEGPDYALYYTLAAIAIVVVSAVVVFYLYRRRLYRF